ncbi:MAG: hypothetical protein R2780_02205 [Crocinitomicaceae bacterium]|nr:hypothetical protein [Crocinitomicaceae bacterium]
MNRSFLSILLVTLIVQYSCEGSRRVNDPKGTGDISYEKNIQPIMLRSCTPCHFPEQGRKAMLNTYELTVQNIDPILERIKLDTTAMGFMPYKNKRLALTPSEIEIFEKWKEQGFKK